jgi:hypothetical protein
VPTLCLSFHAGYRCRHSGACCTSGWAIPVEPALRARLDAALVAGTFRLTDAPAVPGGEARSPFVERARLADGSSILRLAAGGACACYDPDALRCRIHGQLGHDALPVACQHFPRVCLTDRDVTSITLSHYCPTAARLLLAPAARPTSVSDCVAIVEAPAGLVGMAPEGLDARDALPPLLRPRMLADRESYRSWEGLLLRTLSRGILPEAAVATIIDATEALRSWEPRDGLLGDAVIRAFADGGGASVSDASAGTFDLTAAALSFDALARQSVPAGLSAPAVPAAAGDVYTELVAPRWAAFAAPVRRYLAAKAFANWCAYQGRGLRTTVCSLVAALSVLRVEAVRQCAAAGRSLDEPLLVEAFRSADLLLVHLASREELARRFSDVEEAGAGEMRAAVVFER